MKDWVAIVVAVLGFCGSVGGVGAIVIAIINGKFAKGKNSADTLNITVQGLLANQKANTEEIKDLKAELDRQREIIKKQDKEIVDLTSEVASLKLTIKKHDIKLEEKELKEGK